MRADQEVDLCRVAADRHQARADLFARAIVNSNSPAMRVPTRTAGSFLAVGVHAAVEQSEAFGMLDQIGRHGRHYPALAAFHKAAEIAGKIGRRSSRRP
jgi:hypothetical protein